jgi:hypothetical protein
LVVSRKNHRPVIDHSLSMNDAKPKKNSAEQFNEVVANPVIRIHGAW